MGRLMWVFGSVARGVVDESSDIDLLVDYDYRKLTLVPSDALDGFARYVRL
jgi:predicted nucleotidyltransferase